MKNNNLNKKDILLNDSVNDNGNIEDILNDDTFQKEDYKENMKDMLDTKYAANLEHAVLPDVDSEWEKLKLKKNIEISESSVSDFGPSVTKDLMKESKRYSLIIRWVAAAALIGIIYPLIYFMSDRETEQNFMIVADNVQKGVTLHVSEDIIYEFDTDVIPEEIAKEGIDYSTLNSSNIEYLNNTEKADMHTLSVPAGKDFHLMLSDGTKIWVNAETTLRYPTKFEGAVREVFLSGEAYFEVAQNKDIPFIVHSGSVQTKVTGTEFNVRNYDENDLNVTLINGIIDVCHSDNGDFVRVNPGENALLTDNGTFLIEEVDTENFIYWKDGYFFFDNVSLREIMENISKWYNVNVVFINKNAAEDKMHYMCNRNESLDKAILLLNRMKSAEIYLKDNVIYVE